MDHTAAVAINEAIPLPRGRAAGLGLSVLVMMLAMTWVYRGMRAAMDIGGACANNGPYVPVQPCPAGPTALLSIGIPLVVLSALAGSAIAVMLRAPIPLLMMWWLLFGVLGWNFIDYGVVQGDPDDGGLIWGWLICGVMFWAMALPALVLQLAMAFWLPDRLRGRAERLASLIESSSTWWLYYLLVTIAGIGIGWWTFDLWAT